MQSNELEKVLHDRLYDLEEAVNTDATWLAVQAGLEPPKKKRRAIIWWWLGGGFVLLALGGWFIFPSVDIVHPELNAQAVSEAGKGTTPQAGDQQAGNREAITANVSASDQPPGDVPASQLKAQAAPGALAQERRPGKSDNALTKSPTPELPATAPARRRPKHAQANVRTIPPPVAAQIRETSATESPAPTAGFVTARLSAAPTVATLPIALLLPPRDEDIFPTLPPVSDPVDCYSFGQSGKPGWTLSTSAGIAKPYRNDLASNPEDSSQLARNLATERPLEAITADLLVGYHTASGWSLRGGLSYQRINSVVEARTDSTVEVRREGITEIVINPAGDTTFVSGLIDASVRTSSYNRYYNQLTTIDFPLLLGKTFARGKWRLGLEAGPVFNLLSSGSARYQLADGTYSTRAQNEGLFRKRLGGISWRANVSAGILLLPGLEANIGLSALRRSRGGFEVDGSATRTAYDLIGLQVGLKKSL